MLPRTPQQRVGLPVHLPLRAGVWSGFDPMHVFWRMHTDAVIAAELSRGTALLCLENTALLYLSTVSNSYYLSASFSAMSLEERGQHLLLFVFVFLV